MTYFSTADQARAFKRNVSRGRAYEALDRAKNMQDAINVGIAFYGALFDLIGKDDRITLALQDLLSMAAGIQKAARDEIMDAGLLCTMPTINLSELDALLAKVK